MKSPHIDKDEAAAWYRSVRAAYVRTDGVFSEDDDRTYRAKIAVRYALEPWERVLFVLYCELNSQRKVAEAVGLSKGTVLELLRGIVRKIEDFTAASIAGNVRSAAEAVRARTYHLRPTTRTRAMLDELERIETDHDAEDA